jgi:DtxR family Mn-dependent transcriptional regulator
LSLELTDREEDYLRAIYEVIDIKGYSRIKDLSIKVKVTPASVVEMMKKLKEKRLVNYEKYEAITLTETGAQYAKAISRRHDTFKEFLKIINVPDDVAEKDAHILEHYLDAKTINQFTRFVDLVKNPDHDLRLVNVYRDIISDIMTEE